jgi:hypothetical protein
MPLTSGWRSPASSSSRVQGAPLSRLPAPLWRSLAPPWRPRAPPLMTLQRVPPRPPRALPPWPPPRPVETGVGDSTSREGPTPRHSLLLPPPSSPPPPPPTPPPPSTRSSSASPRGRAPAARAAGTPHYPAPRAPAVRFSSPSCAPSAPVPVAARSGQPPGLGASAGQTARRPLSPSTKRQPLRSHTSALQVTGGEERDHSSSDRRGA